MTMTWYKEAQEDKDWFDQALDEFSGGGMDIKELMNRLEAGPPDQVIHLNDEFLKRLLVFEQDPDGIWRADSQKRGFQERSWEIYQTPEEEWTWFLDGERMGSDLSLDQAMDRAKTYYAEYADIFIGPVDEEVVQDWIAMGVSTFEAREFAAYLEGT